MIVQFAISEGDAVRLASFAVRTNDWDILRVIEAALREAGFNEPTVMDVYCQNRDLQKRVRELEAERRKRPQEETP